MRKLGIVGIVMAVAGLSFAQDIKLGGNLGYFKGGKDLKDCYYDDSGIALGGSGVFTIPGVPVDIMAGIGYYKVSGEGGAFIGTPTVGSPTTVKCENSLRVIPITVSAIYKLPVPTVSAYVGGGLGMFVASSVIEAQVGTGTTKTKTEKSKSPIGFQILAGAMYPVAPNISINGEVRYTSAKLKGKDVGTKKDVGIGGTSISIGVVYSLKSK
ncbi:TPA: hypothetical protein DCX16_06840 [bacterium]|nr:hypothetical protein [bacterium]